MKRRILERLHRWKLTHFTTDEICPDMFKTGSNTTPRFLRVTVGLMVTSSRVNLIPNRLLMNREEAAIKKLSLFWFSRSLFCDIQDFIWRKHIWGLLRARSHSLHKLGYRLQRCGNWHYFCQRYLQQDKYTCCNPRVRWYPDFFHQNDRKGCKRVILRCPGTLSSTFLERPGKP